VDLVTRYRSTNYRWRVSQRFFGLSVVKRANDGGEFSLQGPITFLLSIATKRIFYNKLNDYEAYTQPLMLAVTFPTSQFEYAVGRHVMLGFGNNTEAVLIRGNGGVRGINYTPYLSIAYWGYPNGEGWDIGSIQLHAGYNLFWNFEGVDRAEGLTIGLDIRFGYTDFIHGGWRQKGGSADTTD